MLTEACHQCQKSLHQRPLPSRHPTCPVPIPCPNLPQGLDLSAICTHTPSVPAPSNGWLNWSLSIQQTNNNINVTKVVLSLARSVPMLPAQPILHRILLSKRLLHELQTFSDPPCPWSQPFHNGGLLSWPISHTWGLASVPASKTTTVSKATTNMHYSLWQTHHKHCLPTKYTIPTLLFQH